MAGFIKSHSNYRLQKRHQITNDGVIFERDISTVGGVNSFATGQATIYQSGNYIIVVNNSSSASRHVKNGGWLASGYKNDTWDINALSQHSSDINGSVEDKIFLKNDFMDLRSFAYYGSLYDLVQNTISKILSTFPFELCETENVVSGSSYYEVSNPGLIDIHNIAPSKNIDISDLGHFYNGGCDNYSIYFDTQDEAVSGTGFSWSVNPLPNIVCPQSGVVFSVITLLYDSNNIVIYAYWDYDLNVKYMTQKSQSRTGLFHIRPRMDKSYYDDFIDGLDLFGKCLIGIYSGIKNTAKFEVLEETEYGVRKKLRLFEFPTDYGNYNLGSDSLTMQEYISSLGGIALNYDSVYTDNLYRLMTHDSLKNLDWTKYFNTNDESDNEYIKNGEKFSSVIRIMGYTFDNTKAYIDSIENVDCITYSNRNNLADYFLSDKLGDDGWVVNTIYPYELTEYNRSSRTIILTPNGVIKDHYRTFNGSTRELSNYFYSDGIHVEGGTIVHCSGLSQEVEKNILVISKVDDDNNFLSEIFKATSPGDYDIYIVDDCYISISGYYENLGGFNIELNTGNSPIDWSESAQTIGKYDRKFSEITSEIIEPYSYIGKCYYTKCENDSLVEEEIDDCSDSKYYVDGGIVHNVMSDYHNNLQITIPDINNEFIKRFCINSKYILRKKGTIDGIESILSLFGLKSKKWCESHVNSYSGVTPYDFDVNEYIMFTPPIDDVYDNVHSMYKYDWYNKCKTIPYNTDSYINGKYIPYQGLPVAYMSSGDNMRKLYPFFDSNGIYDGGMYYQMNGGWIGYLPYMFDNNNDIIKQDENYNVRVETMRNVSLVNNIGELLNQPKGDLFDGIIYYVNDISQKYALIDGFAYPLIEDEVSGETKYYFETKIYGSSITVGDTLYTGNVTVSDSRNISGLTEYNLDIYEDGSIVRVYYTGTPTFAFIVGNSEYISYETISDIVGGTDEDSEFTSYIFSGGTYPNSDADKVSHYFKLVNTENSDRIGVGYWEKIKSDTTLYKIIDSVIDKTIGNNPHSGNYSYDNGMEYIERFNKLFKYASSNKLFDEPCFSDVDTAYNEIDGFGFSCSAYTDDKVHAFLDSFDSEGTVTEYDKSSTESLSSIHGYEYVSSIGNADSVTEQIINTKMVEITFYIGSNDMYNKLSQEKIKYIQSKIMPYVEQVIPSTCILDVKYSN